MPHNHSPRCCCEHTYNGAIVTSAKPCPSCTEHGELATLGNNAPFIDCPQCDARADGTPCTHRPPADAGHPAECPSCHAVGDQPHTDYCQLPLTDALIASQVARLEREVTAQAVRAHERDHEVEAKGATWHQTGPHEAHERYRCRPDICGWPAQTSQPAATTSQPPTHTRPLQPHRVHHNAATPHR